MLFSNVTAGILTLAMTESCQSGENTISASRVMSCDMELVALRLHSGHGHRTHFVHLMGQFWPFLRDPNYMDNWKYLKTFKYLKNICPTLES
jgi:hypothetical protein